jgi:hypothetical protein
MLLCLFNKEMNYRSCFILLGLLNLKKQTQNGDEIGLNNGYSHYFFYHCVPVILTRVTAIQLCTIVEGVEEK